MTSCNPPTNTKFCPGALARTAGFGSHPPVANADKVDDKHAGDLLRVARGSLPYGVALSSAPRTITSVDMTAPGPGYVLVSATMDITYLSGGTCPCMVRYYVAEGSSESNGGLWQHQLIQPASGFAQNHPVATQWVFPVDGAGARTYTLRAQQFSGTGEIFAGVATITALYVPFGANGTGP